MNSDSNFAARWFPNGLPLRVTVLAAFLIAYAPAVVAIIYYNHFQNQARVEREVTRFIEVTAARAVDRTGAYFEPAVAYTGIWAQRMAPVPSPVADVPRILPTALEVLRRNPQFYSIVISRGGNDVFSVSRVVTGGQYGVAPKAVPSQAQYAAWLINRAHGEPERRSFFDSDLHRLSTTTVPDSHVNVTTRSWYRAAIQESDVVVDGPYVLLTAGRYGLGFAQRMEPTPGGVQGVAAIAVTLDDLSTFLQSNRIGVHGAVAVFNDRGVVLAAGTSEPNVMGGGEAAQFEGGELPNLGTMNDAGLRGMAGRQFRGSEWLRFRSDGKEYSALVIDLARPFNGKVYLGLTVDRAEFFDPIVRETTFTAAISLLVGLLGLLLILWFSVQIAHPVRRLVEEAHRLSRLELGQPVRTRSVVTEVRELFDGFQTMQAGLAAFTKYVPHIVVQDLIVNKAMPAPGGEDRTLSILFTDVQDFTKLSEGMPPRDLFLKATRYYREIGSPILGSGGMIGRFMGDGIVAYWNAPQSDPDHMTKAAQATLVSRAQSEALNRHWERIGWPIMRTRFGLHVGEAIVGNVGLPDRLEYNAMGECLNIASRLEGLNKMYGTQILISETMKNQLPETFLWRWVDRVMPKGTSIAFGICELIGMAGALPDIAPTDEQVDLAHRWNRTIVTAYLAQDWPTALSAIEQVLHRAPEDPLARIYEARCREFQKNSPGAGWDGVVRYSEK